MDIKLWKGTAEAIGRDNLKPFGINFDQFRWEKSTTVDLARFSTAKVLDLKNIIVEHAWKHKGAQQMVKDIDIWLAAARDGTDATAKNAKIFHTLVLRFMQKVPGQRLYQKNTARDVWFCYYLYKVVFHPTVNHGSGWITYQHTTLHFAWREFGVEKVAELSFFDEDVRGKTVAQALKEKDEYIAESAELRASFVADLDKYVAWHEALGKQFWATGEADDDLDGNGNQERNSWWKRTKSIRMDKDGEPGRILIDVFREEDTEETTEYTRRQRRRSEDNNKIDLLWWVKVKKNQPDEDGDFETDEDALTDAVMSDDDTATQEPEIPIHPLLSCFDLKRHLRVRLHTGQLTEYVYDKALGDKLVLPQEDRDLIDILLAHKSTFADVVSGKGGGSVVLCTGGPGLGKTLTAELYSEVAARPLYTVQCSQLGTEPDALEENLLKCLARGERWGAIMLLDEADVYIRPRGDDLQQNAIVGVFLRVLEYYRGVMFMTTNRPDLIDDAIASRCIARIQYELPNDVRMARIWRDQAALNGATIAAKELAMIINKHPGLSGRDIKNLMKLALLVAESRHENAVITAAIVTFVKRFKSTEDLRAARAAQGEK